MFTTERSPFCEEDTIVAVDAIDTIDTLAASLAELEAIAWLRDMRIAAMLIGAARIELRESGQTATHTLARPPASVSVMHT